MILYPIKHCCSFIKHQIIHFVYPPNFSWTIIHNCSWEDCSFPRVSEKILLIQNLETKRVEDLRIVNCKFPHSVKFIVFEKKQPNFPSDLNICWYKIGKESYKDSTKAKILWSFLGGDGSGFGGLWTLGYAGFVLWIWRPSLLETADDNALNALAPLRMPSALSSVKYLIMYSG